ncbi:hypothetical protein [Marinilabilia salmonicolor]|uniref:Uncharacterized protein n=1 Tax=Marinilabilia salmonicolor TaxID=989 RepID=A0A368USV5_9BACT|nr:hypothetical protein [Marinilabilia salmonicolor]RCW31110.1 hypothetical protein DFO77_11978 [Marinilabilia salmonicolor]
MIFNIKIVIVVIFAWGCCSSQPESIIYDIYGEPIISYNGDSLKSGDAEYYKKGRSVRIGFDVKYVGGVDSLKKHIIESYYEHSDYNHQEVNTTLFFCVFFDENLKIENVRFIDVGFSNQQKALLQNNLNLKIITEIIKETEGEWHIKSKDQFVNNQVFLGSIKLM